MTINGQDIGIKTYFSRIKDPRKDRTKRHKLIDIIVIAVCAIICGAEGWESMEVYGIAKKEWLETILELPNGIPSPDTFRRVFERIKPEVFSQCFVEWTRSLFKETKGDIIPIDGKTVRRSHDKSKGKAAIHMVSAWSSANQMVMGQVKTSEKSNEITAIPELLDMIELAGGIITIDAMGCQKKIASKIVSKGADYVLAVKGNQKKLMESITPYFEDVKAKKYESYDFHQTLEKGHGRIEKRRFWTYSDLTCLKSQHPQWEKLTCIGCVESTRTLNQKTSTERRYYISSLAADAKQLAKATRAHWGIENSLHWVLDVTFREDNSRIRSKYAPENLATLRHIVINLVRQEKTLKRGAPQKRLKAACDNHYLEKILAS